MQEQQIEDIKNAIREMMQLVTQRGQPLSDELKLRVAQVLEHAANRIMQLRQEQQGQEPEIPNLPPEEPDLQQTMPSSNIYGFNYDYDNDKLLVKFQGNDGEGEGPIYQYEGVPKYIFNLFRQGAAVAKTTGRNKWGEWFRGKSPSLGAAMHAFIKNGNYPYQRVQ